MSIFPDIQQEIAGRIDDEEFSTPEAGSSEDGCDDDIPICKLKKGDPDPTTDNKILEVIYVTSNFIVTIDERYSLNWYAKSTLEYAEDFGLLLGKISLADALVDRIFSDEKNDRLAYKRMLGDVLARLLDDRSSTHALVAFAEVEARIEEHARERTRIAYINRAKIWVGIAAALLLLITIFRPWLYLVFDNRVIFNILVCSLLGAIGSFISAFLRFKDYKGSIKSGLDIHKLDGFLRVIFGLVAGLFIALAMQGGILAAFAVSDDVNKIWLFFFFGLIAGSSERLVPNLIEQVENQQVNGQSGNPAATAGTQSSATNSNSDRNVQQGQAATQQRQGGTATNQAQQTAANTTAENNGQTGTQQDASPAQQASAANNQTSETPPVQEQPPT